MYGKHFSSTYTGSMVGAGVTVFAVWGYVIANTRKSRIELNPKLLAVILGCKEEGITKALKYLTAPDPESRSKENEGRRIVKEGQYQYFVPTFEAYRSILNEDERREYNRLKKAESRARHKDVKEQVIDMSAVSAQAEAEAEAEAVRTATESKTDSDLGGHVLEKAQQPPGEEITAYWNAKPRLGTVHPVAKLTPARMRHLKARWAEPEFRDNWKKIIDKADDSDFLVEACKPFNFLWVIQNQENYVKILEGRYKQTPKGDSGWTV